MEQENRQIIKNYCFIQMRPWAWAQKILFLQLN